MAILAGRQRLPLNPSIAPSAISQAWRLAALYLATAAMFADLYLTQPMLPLISREFDVSAAQAGMTISAVSLAMALTSSSYGPLSGAIGRKRVMVVGMIVTAIVTLLCAFAPSLQTLIILRALQGVAVPSVTAIAVAYLSAEYPPSRLGTLVGGYIASSVLGGLLGRVVTCAILEGNSWRLTFVVFAALTALSAIAAQQLLKGHPTSFSRRLPAEIGNSYRMMFASLHDTRLIGTYIVGGAIFFGFVGIFTYIPYLLSNAPFNLSAGALTWIYVTYAAGIIIAPFAGYLSTRIPERTLISTGFALSLVGITCTLAGSMIMIFIGCTILCSGMFLTQSIAPTFVSRIAGSGPGRDGALSFYQAIYYTGAVFGSVLPGLAWQHFGWPGVVVTCGLVLSGGLVVAIRTCGPKTAVPLEVQTVVATF
ncbi:MAG TPA: MFS transporter [Candidatus Baltobacteraceae bacterium]|jgi:YNFM family putative membrane transporter|nr:MFS transporter [Candidatus Baltobacteraceae bacterium]